MSALSDVLRSKLLSQVKLDDTRAALICHTLTRLWCENPPEFETFMPSYGLAKASTNQPLSDDEMTAKVSTIMKLLGGKQE